MNLRQIEIFHAVYMHGTVSAAARALKVSQPCVTKVLRHAEKSIGMPLFERSKGRLIPTGDARALFGEVEEIQERVQAFRRACKKLSQGEHGILRVAALPSLGLEAIPDAVVRFREAHMDISLDLQTAHHSEMVRSLFERETDIAISFDVPDGAPLKHRVIGEGELVALFREEDFPDAPPRLHLEDLCGFNFITPMHSGPIGDMLAEELTRLDVGLSEKISVRTYYIAAGLVRAGMGMAIVDNFTAHACVSQGLVHRPLQPALTFDVNAVHLEQSPPLSAADDFIDILADVVDAL